MKRIFIFFLIFISFVSKSQAYKPTDSVVANYKSQLILKYEFEKNQILESLKNKDSQKRKIYREIYTGIYDDLLKQIHRNEIYYHPKLQDYIKDIIKDIAVSHTEIKPENIKILISRNPETNAFTIVNGTIVFNQNFLTILDNENQLSAVLAHEIGHYLGKHSESKIDNLVASYTNDSIVAVSKNVKAQKFNRNTAAEKILRGITYNRYKSTRENEIKSDAKSFEILGNSKYSNREIISLLKNLDVSDLEQDSLTEKDYKYFFTLPNETFDDKLLKGEDASEYAVIDENYFKWNVDSLKTHPSCDERIAIIEKLKPNENPVYAKNANLFSELKKNAELENIQNQYVTENYGRSLYSTLKVLKKNPEEPYAKKMLVKNLRKLKDARDKRTYGKYIIPPNPKEHTTSLQTFYILFDNISNTRFNEILDFYEKKYADFAK